MVANSPGRVRAALAAALVLLLLPLSSLPIASAQLELVQVESVYVNQGEAEILQSSFRQGKGHTSFVDGSTTDLKLSVPVYNQLQQTLNGVPVYIELAGHDRRKCIDITIPAATDGKDGMAWANWTFNINDLARGAYNVTIAANVDRPNGFTDATDCGRRGSDQLLRRDGTENNRAVAYFVKDARLDLTIVGMRWCAGTSASTVCNSFANVTQDPYLVVPADQGGPGAPIEFVHFQADVINVGTWEDMVDYGGPEGANSRFRYPITFAVKAPDGKTQLLRSTGEGAGWQNSATWNLTGKAGIYNVTATIDPLGTVRQVSQANDTSAKDFEVAWRDLTANFTASDFKTNASDPYPYQGAYTLRGNITIRNDGPAPILYDEQDHPYPILWRIYLDSPTSRWNLSANEYNTTIRSTIGNHSSWIVPISWTYTDNKQDDNYIAPGKHTIHVELDYIGQNATYGNTYELDETNNRISLDIYLNDTQAPTIKQLPLLRKKGPSDPPLTSAHPNEGFRVYAHVTDDDQDALRVRANFTLVDGNQTHHQEFPLGKFNDTWFFAYVQNLSMATNATQENWTLRVHAVDVFGNAVTSDEVALRLTKWPLHNATQDYVAMQYRRQGVELVPVRDGGNISWANDNILFETYLPTNMTGHPRNDTRPIHLDLVTPTGTLNSYDGKHWTHLEYCTKVDGDGIPDAPDGIPDNNKQPPSGEVDCQNSDRYRFNAVRDMDGSAPGKWNAWINITDIGNQTRVIHRTFNYVDLLPQVHGFNLSRNVTEPGQSFTVQANLSDDFSVDSAYLNFTRLADGYVANYTLSNLTKVPSGTGGTYYLYNTTLETGRNKAFGEAGVYNVTVDVVDTAGNWNKSRVLEFRLNDTDNPRIDAAGVTPPEQEIGENVTFYARATDSTNVSAYLQVLRGSEEIFPKVKMVEGADGNITFETNISTEGTYRWIIEVFDSAGRSLMREGGVAIRENLGPRFEIRSPSTIIDGQRYGLATPRIELLVYDTDGVDPASIEMNVGDLPVAPEIERAGGGINGWIISYAVPPGKKYEHQDQVAVNVTAIDNSTSKLLGGLNFTFVVDDAAPTARIVAIEPSYRDQPTHPLNVSLETRFELAASDDDGLPTKADVIKFRIVGGGNNAIETVYTGPFRITDVPGVYTGPRIYQVQFWAEDSVGNFNRAYNLTTIFVDDTPPALHQFFPQGRYINATFVDDRVGVDRALVWYRTTPTGIYNQERLVDDGEMWRAVLPEGKKGDVVSYYIQVWDKLGNSDTFGNASSPYATFDVSNHAPEMRLTAPATGSSVGGPLELRWQASDQDGDDLIFTVYVKAPGSPSFSEIARLENTNARSYRVDTTKVPDGQYTYRVAASDGAYVKLAEATVTILNRAGAVGVVSAPTAPVVPGETILIKAEITKAQATVEAHVYRNGEFVDSYPMNDRGENGDEVPNDGVYSVRVPVDAAGDYSVDIVAQYQENGELKEQKEKGVAVFSASLTPAYILSEYGGVLALIGLLALVGIGIAVFVVMRRR